MKTRFKRLSKSTVSVLLALLMVVSTVTVGIIATSAAYSESESVGFSNQFYFTVPLSWTQNGYTIKVDANRENDQGGTSWAGDTTATDTGETYCGYRLYSVTIETWSSNKSFKEIWAKAYNNSTKVDELQLNNSNVMGNINGKCSYTAVSGNYPDFADYKTDNNYYLSGYLGKSGNSSSDVNASSPDYHFSRSGNNYTLSYVVNGDQYLTINMKNDRGSHALHPASDNSTSGTYATVSDTSYSGSGNNKWKVTASAGQTVSLTYNSYSHMLTWTVTSPVTYTATLADGGSVGGAKTAIATLSGNSQTTSTADGTITGLTSGSTVTIKAYPASGKQANITASSGTLSSSVIATSGGEVTLTMTSANTTVTITYGDATGEAVNNWFLWKGSGENANPSSMTKINTQLYKIGDVYYAEITPEELNGSGATSFTTGYYTFAISNSSSSYTGIRPVYNSNQGYQVCTTAALLTGSTGFLTDEKAGEYGLNNGSTRYSYAMVRINSGSFDKLRVEITSNANPVFNYDTSNKTNYKFGIVNEVVNDFDGYYLAGRITTTSGTSGAEAKDFKADSTSLKFKPVGGTDATATQYKFETGKTIAELSTPVTVTANDIRPQYFVINDRNRLWGDSSNASSDFYYNTALSKLTTNQMAYSSVAGQARTDTELLFELVHTDNEDDGKVVIWLDTSGVSDKKEGGGSMKIWYTVEGSTTPLAGGVTLTASPASQVNTKTMTLTATLTGLAADVNKDNCTYNFYDGDTELTGEVTKKSDTQATYTFPAPGTSGTHNFRVVVTTEATYTPNGGAAKPYRQVSAKTTGTFTDPATYISSDITNGVATATWSKLTDNAVNNIGTKTLSAGQSYTFSLSDEQGFNPLFAKYTIDEAKSKYVDISYGQKTVTVDGEAVTIRTYIFTPRVNCSNPTIYVDTERETVYAVATYNEVGTLTNTFSESKTYRYYFAEVKNHDNGSNNGADPLDGIKNGIKISYWNASSNESGTTGKKNGTPVNQSGAAVTAGTDAHRIYIDQSALIAHTMGATKTDSETFTSGSKQLAFQIYYVDIPVWATSFKFANSSGNGITSAWEVLNPNRVYLLFEWGNSAKVSAAVLDESLWTNNNSSSTTSQNQAPLYYVDTNLIKYDRGTSNANDATTANAALSTRYNAQDTAYPLYFGNYAAWSQSVYNYSQPGKIYHNFDIRWNLAQRGENNFDINQRKTSGGCAYYASIWNLTGFMMDKTKLNNLGGYTLTNPNNDNAMPLFDYDNLSGAATVYRNKKFPFYKSTYNGITTYSYDSLSDPNRLYNTTTNNYVVEDTVGSVRALNGLPGYQPFEGQQHSIANEFDINFYMTNTGAMTPTTKINGEDQDIAFNFSGDDDVWVYVDGVKVLDLGGDHMISAGSINFTDMKVYYKTAANTPAAVAAITTKGYKCSYPSGYEGLGGSWAYDKNYVYTVDLQDLFDAAGVNFKNTDASVKHKLQMFYVERGQNESNFSVEFNLPQASGLSIKNNVTTKYVNPGLVNAALTAASGDYFVYSIQDALASAENVNTVKGKGDNYANVRSAAAPGEISLNFAKPVYPANINAVRNVNGVQYVLAQAGQSAVYAEGYSAPTSTSFVDVGGVNYYLSDENLEGKAADLSGKILQTASGDAQANKLYLLSGQMANFRDSIGGNTKVKVQQYATLGETKDENTLTKYQAVAKNDTGNYYITSYKIEEDNINKELQAQTGYTMLRNDESLTAIDTNSGLDDSFYFSSYSSDTDRNSPAMTVEYYNDIAVGEIRVEKKLDKIYSTQGTKFRFTVQFANIFGDDEFSTTLQEYSGLEYYLFNSADDTPVTDTPQIYDPAVGIILEAGQYAKITGVPVETRFKVTERVTANHSLVQIAKTATKNNGEALNNTSLGINSSTFYNETLDKNSTGTKLAAFNAMSTSDDNQTVSEDDMTYYVNMIPIIEESIINNNNRSFNTLAAAENGYESVSKVVFTNKKESFSVVFKYFDRLEENDTPSQIKTTPTEYSFNLESLDEYTNLFTSSDTLPEGKSVNDFKNFDFQRLIQDKAVEFANNTTGINNLLDNYTMWVSQNDAVTAMKAKINAKVGGAAYTSSNDIMYHTDYIGQMLTESQASGERWVTYKDKSGKVLADPYGFSQCGKTEVGYADGDVTRYDAVKSIVVWCFNEPKKYTVNVHHAAENDTMTSTAVIQNGVSKTFYKSSNTGVTTIDAYYNQRLGFAMDGYDDAGFFEQYGISGVTGVKPGDYRVNTINENNSPKYQFAYWAYDAAGTQVASTEWHFAYRVTKSIDLYPIYTTIENPVSVGYGVTAVEDQADRYVDGTGNSKTRLNVLFNPYGLDDNDSNIKKSVILNIIFTDSKLAELNAKGEGNDSAIISLFNTNRTDLATYLNTHASAVMTDSIAETVFSPYVNRSFMFTMKGNSTASPTDVVVELTNKNRMQFTSIFNTSTLYRAGKEQKILQVTAMKYNDKWIISDNCIVNRFAAAAD